MRTLLLFVAICIGQGSHAQENQYPPSFSSLLEPGDFVGIDRDADSGIANVTVYPQRVFEVLRDAQELDERALEEKYPELEQMKETYRDAHENHLPRSRDGKVAEYESISVYSYRRTSYSQVVFVGEDYFVVRKPGESERGSAISCKYIHGISWRDDVPFTASIRYVAAD